MPTGLLFPGQGSQHVGMGLELSSVFPEARRTLEEADDILGVSLSTMMTLGPQEELTETRNAQPALLTHSVAVLRVLGDRLAGPAMAAGHSLGEFSAYVAAGTLRFEDALRAVRLRGELMFEAGQRRPGTMAAILGLDDAEVEAVCAAASDASGVVVPANLNSPGQVVISGDIAAVGRAGQGAREAGAKRVVPLQVSGAFHSPLMEPAQEGLREALESVKFDRPAYPVVSNVTAAEVVEGDRARELLVEQLTSPVRWSESIRRMVDRGCDRFVEIGAGSVLTGLNRRNAKGVESMAVGEPADLERFGP
jgi:[acyl-carrier-protein] S-malonyltransferase